MRKHNKETTSHFCFKFAGKIPKSKQLFSVFLKSPIKNTNENWHEIFKFYQQFAPSSHEKNTAWRRGMSVWRLYRQRVPKGCIFHMLSLRLLSDLWSPLGWAGYMMAACVCYYSLSLLALSISSRIKKHCPAFPPAPNSLLLSRFPFSALNLSSWTSVGPLIATESGVASSPVSKIPPLTFPHLHLSRTPTGDTFLLPIASRLEKAVASRTLTNKARFGDQGPWCIFLFIPMHAHLCVCYNDFRGLEGTFRKD